jgi:transposase
MYHNLKEVVMPKYSLEVGMDLHKLFSVFAAVTPEGKVVTTQRVQNNAELFDQFFASLKFSPIRVTVESTLGVNWVIDYFERKNIDLVVSNPFLNRAIANVKCKNDKYDAATLADLTRSNMIARCYVPPRNMRELRELIIHRLKLVRTSTTYKNKVHKVLSHYSYIGTVTDIFGPTGRKWLATLEMSQIHRNIVDECLEILNVLAPRILALEKTVVNMAHKHVHYKPLVTIPGIGPLNASIIISRVDTIHRFNKNVDKFIKYAGLSVNTRSSADKIHLGSINKRSDKLMRTAFVDAAIVAVTKDPGLCQFNQYLTALKGKGIAKCAVARKLARSAFFVMLTGKPYKYRLINPRYMTNIS